MMTPDPYVGRSAQIADKSADGLANFEKKLEPYQAAIQGAKEAELSCLRPSRADQQPSRNRAEVERGAEQAVKAAAYDESEVA